MEKGLGNPLLFAPRHFSRKEVQAVVQPNLRQGRFRRHRVRRDVGDESVSILP